MNMVEKVARAICKAEYGSEDAGWENQIPAALAAIEAMREPTKEMLAAIKDAADCYDGQSPWTAEAGYRTGIDAALSEGREP